MGYKLMINNVDVSECECLQIGDKVLCGALEGRKKCEEWETCLYKRIWRKEEELKKGLLQQCPNCNQEYLNPKGAELYEENIRLKQTLANIKEITEEKKKVGDWLALEISQIIDKVIKNENNN